MEWRAADMVVVVLRRWWVEVNWALEREWVRGISNCWAVDEKRARKREKQRRKSVEGAILKRMLCFKTKYSVRERERREEREV